MLKPSIFVLLLAMTVGYWSCSAPTSGSPSEPSFQIKLPVELADEALDGRLLVMLSTNTESEPRFQISDGPGTQLAFGMNVENWEPGTVLEFRPDTPGYPLVSMAEIPEREYQVQVLLHKYETFERGDGHTVKLPMDRGEGQQWNRAPGNLLNTPQTLTIAGGKTYELAFDQAIDPITPLEDTEWVKHVKIRSDLLSEFWGRDMYLGAHVLLPKGWAEHPELARLRPGLAVHLALLAPALEPRRPLRGDELRRHLRDHAVFFRHPSGCAGCLVVHAAPSPKALTSCGRPAPR